MNPLLKKIQRKLRNSSKESYDNPLNYKNVSKLFYYMRLFEIIKDIDGDVVECGVGRGKSLLLFSYIVKDEMKGRKIWGFDSFEGFPEPVAEDMSSRNSQKGEWSNTSIPQVTKFLHDGGITEDFVKSQVTLIKGFFSESVHKYRGDGIALLHLDGDLYESYKDPLEVLYPKVKRGGVVMFDEYMNTSEHMKFPGGHKAIDEYFGEKTKDFKRDQTTGKYYVIKE